RIVDDLRGVADRAGGQAHGAGGVEDIGVDVGDHARIVQLAAYDREVRGVGVRLEAVAQRRALNHSIAADVRDVGVDLRIGIGGVAGLVRFDSCQDRIGRDVGTVTDRLVADPDAAPGIVDVNRDVRTDRGIGTHELIVVDAGVVHGGDVHHVAAGVALDDHIAAHRVDAAGQVGPVGLQVDLVVEDLAADAARLLRLLLRLVGPGADALGEGGAGGERQDGGGEKDLEGLHGGAPVISEVVWFEGLETAAQAEEAGLAAFITGIGTGAAGVAEGGSGLE